MPDRRDNLVQNQTPDQALRLTRAVWAGLLGSQVMFPLAIVWLQSEPDFRANLGLADMLFQTALWGFLIFVPLGYFLRTQVYKRNWSMHAVRPGGYFVANLILLVLCETVSFVGWFAVLMAGRITPMYATPSMLAILVQVLNWPNGKPMKPARAQGPS